MNKEHSSTTLIKDCIFSALMLLMEQKKYEEITITEIAKKAGVSRMSYYRTYASKDDILIQYFNHAFETALKELQATERPTMRQFDYKFFCLFKEHHVLLQNLMEADLHKLILKQFIKYTRYLAEHIFGLDLSDPIVQYRIHYEAGSIHATAIHWLETGMKETPEEMTDLLEHIRRTANPLST